MKMLPIGIDIQQKEEQNEESSYGSNYKHDNIG
jgi:hypothetical protein